MDNNEQNELMSNYIKRVRMKYPNLLHQLISVIILRQETPIIVENNYNLDTINYIDIIVGRAIQVTEYLYPGEKERFNVLLEMWELMDITKKYNVLPYFEFNNDTKQITLTYQSI